MLVEKGLPFEEVNVDLGKKPQHFVDTYAEITLDPEARAKAPILEVGTPGEPGFVRLVESEVVSRFIEDAFPDPPMQSASPAERAQANLFVATFMELVAGGYTGLMAAKSQEKIDAAMVMIRRGLFAVEAGLRRRRHTGSAFFGGTFGLCEALTAPFVIRLLVNAKRHRGVDILAFTDVPLAVEWLRAVQAHPSVVETSPSEKSLCAIAPFLEPFLQAAVSPAATSYVPKSAAEAEAAFASQVDQGLMHKGKPPRDRGAVAPTSKL